MDLQNQPLTKRQRRELRKQEQQQNQEKFARQKTTTKVIVTLVIILVVAGLGYLIVRSGNSNNTVNTAASADNPILGSETATVVVTEFSDLSCPACATLAPTIRELADAYGDRIKINFSSFDVGHQWSKKSLEAGACANAQGKFWEFSDLMFERQSSWATADDAIDLMKSYAGEVELDTASFGSCLDSGQMADTVSADVAVGRAKRVTATPTVYINDEKLVGVKSLDDYKKIIDPLLSQ